MRLKRVYILTILFVCFSVLTVWSNNSIDATASAINSIVSEFDSTKGAWWYGGLAKEMHESEQYANAVEFYNFAIKIDAEVAEFYFYRGNAFSKLRESEMAMNDFKRALELNPDYFSVLTNNGWDFFKEGNYRLAYRQFSEYLLLILQNPRQLFGMGLKSKYLQLLNQLGWESMRANNLPNSLRYFTNYSELVPNDPDVFLGLALVYFKYNDFENALLFLDRAKNLEPFLYQGSSGIAVLEQKGCMYTEEDKQLIQTLFATIGNKMRDMENITTASTWKLLMGLMYIVLGLISFSIFAIRFKKTEGFIFYLGLLNISFGLKMLHDNPLIQLTNLPSAVFWNVSLPLVTFIVPIAFILFIRYFIGWGWKHSILVLLVYSVIQGLIRVFSDFTEPIQDIYGTTNTIFGFLAVVVLFLHLFLPEMRKNIDVQIIGAGLGFYLLALFYNNLAKFQWLPERLSFDDPAYFFFNISLIYVAFSRITHTEKEFYAVKKDLETAKNIQNAILPGSNPKGKAYELSSVYLPMALIGGDYYDYQIQDDSHIGLLIADVSGHGISAALIASMLKVAFTGQSHIARYPSKVLQQINLSLNGQLNNEFITAGYMSFDLVNKKLVYSSAGHPPMVLLRRKTNEISEIKVKGIPIGVMEEASFLDIEMQLELGDRLVLYTDGILDVFNPSAVAIGKDRFIDLIKETKNLFVEDATASILEKIYSWSEIKEAETYDDDITLIIFDVI